MILYKIIISILLLSLISIHVESQDFFYYLDNRKIDLIPDYSEFYVVCQKNNEQRFISNVKNKFTESNIIQIKNCVYKIKSNKSPTIYNNISKLEGTISVYPSRYTKQNIGLNINNSLICLPKKGVSIDRILTEFKMYSPILVETFNVGYAFKYLINIDYSYNVIDVSNYLQESGLVEFSNPGFIHEIELNETSDGSNDISIETSDCLTDPYFEPNDTYYWDKQWYLKRCEAIRAPYAWVLTQGSQDVIVAILDMGFALQHPEFTGKYLGQYNAIANNSNVDPNCYERHGTRVAGILGAITDNNNGIASIGYNTKFLPIKIISVSEAYPHSQTLYEPDLIRAEQYLINNYSTANIIALNCSWQIAPTPNVEALLQNLRNNLRGGKGASMVFCSGNEGSNTIWYPASSQYTIGVGGSYLYTSGIVPHSVQKKWPGANYGQDLDLVAPAARMFTTDLPGSTGCDNPDYTFSPENVNGTSYAAPLVCGAIALMASINPDLTRAQFESIIMTNTNKFGGYSYNENHQFGTWNNEVGYGVLDVFACVSNIPIHNLCINGPVVISNQHPVYSATNSVTATCNNSTFVITNTGSVEFQAGNSISLLPGFQAITGSNFRAYLQASDNDNFSDLNNTALYQNKIIFSSNSVVKPKILPNAFSLFQNYPNPFNPSTLIQYGLKGNVNVKITVYDILGRVIKTLVNDFQDAGYRSVIWDGTNNFGSSVATGLYIYKIVAGNFVESKKMLLLK